MLPDKTEFIRSLRNLLSASARTGSALMFPTLLISGQVGSLAKLKRSNIPAADIAASFFTSLGFRADRTTMNTFGYPGLLRELANMPPWAELTLDHLEDTGCPCERHQALYRLANEMSAAELSSRYRQHADMRFRWLDDAEPKGQLLASQELVGLSVEQFDNLIVLARCLGVEAYEDVAEAVFEFDEFPPYTGAPDIFVWLPDPAEHLWFFAEVKAPKDALRKTQSDWLMTNWERIRARFVQVILEG